MSRLTSNMSLLKQLFLIAYRATPRYIAPESIKVYSKVSAIPLAKVLFPQAEWPSMAMVIFFFTLSKYSQ